MPTRKLPKELEAGQKAQRFFTLDVASRQAIDSENRTAQVAFASETPVPRWYGNEILDMNSSSIRMDRLQSGGAVLMDHDWTDQVGVVDSVQVGADRVARATLRFGKSARASEVFQDLVDGIRTNISVGYQIHSAVLESDDDGDQTYRITDWEPYEISIVAVPADTSVGVGRAAYHIRNEEKVMPEAIATPAAAAPAATVDTTAAQRSGAESERSRVASILGIADAYKRYNLHELAAEAVRAGMSTEEFKGKAMERMAAAPKPTADIGMSEKEKRNYSFVRMMNALANPTNASAREAAAFEFECSTEAQKRSGQLGKPGITIPFDVLNRGHAKRDLTAGGSTTGSKLVETDLLAEDFITLLRNRMVINQLGVQTLTGLQGNIAIPRQTGAGTTYWVAENNAPTEADQTIDQVSLSPKTVAAWTDISRRLLLQSSLDVESMVQSDLATILALAIQAAAIKGGGSNQPTGILATSGIGSVADSSGNGSVVSWADVVALETAIASANADVGTLAYLTNAKVRGKAKVTAKIGSTYPIFLWADGDTPLNGYRAAVTNAVPSNGTVGTASGVCSDLIFGNFADLLIGMWGGLDLMVDPYSKSTTGAVRVVVMQDCDVAVRHPESFAAKQDCLTA